MRTHVDVLTMSATPIPRTLEMSLAGIRGDVDDPDPARGALPGADLRRPARRQAGRRGAAARDAARRAGLLHPQPGAGRSTRPPRGCARWCPRPALPSRTGRCPRSSSERTVEGFWNREYDILVCTTIVETGLDISNANTLIVERADTFGLSQLHQLRGRVGPQPRAWLRVLPVSAGGAAHRDRLRPAGHHRAEQRARRGHGGGDEGSRDPRRGKRARRRAVRPRRRRRLRPVRAAGRRGGRGLPRRGRRENRSGAGGTEGCADRPAGRRASAAGLHRQRPVAAGGLSQAGGRRPTTPRWTR